MKHRTMWSVLSLIAVLAVGSYPLAAQPWQGSPGFPGSSEGEPSTEGPGEPPTETPGEPPAVDDCLSEVIVISPGQEVEFSASTTLTGVWSAAFGTVSTSGVYAAPATVPPDGIDTVDFVGSDGSFLSFIVAVQPPGIVPMPSTALSWTDEGSAATPPTLPGEPPSSFGTSTVSSAPSMSAVGVSAVTPLSTLLIGGESMVTVPPLSVVSTLPLSTTLYAQSNAPLKKARKCGVLPLPPWKGDSCTGNGERATIGPMQTTSYSGQENMPPIRVSTRLQGRIKSVFGIDVSAEATFPVSRQVKRYRQWYNKDVYRCVNGQWKFAYTRQCSRTGVEYFAWSPVWAALVYGYPPSGVQWSSWSCRNV
jgi:hypothetical protein